MVSRLTALVPGSVCAAAVGRGWPPLPTDQVRCIDEGSRALGLAHCCAPWPHEAEYVDMVTSGLVRTPGALPVLGLVRGPLLMADRMGAWPEDSDESQERIDAASDSVTASIRALNACGVQEAVVLEGLRWPICEDCVIEAHRPLLNAAAHLRLDLLLVADGPLEAASLGYERWVSKHSCSPRLSFLPNEAFDSTHALERCLEGHRAASDADEVITAPLDDRVSLDLLRHASRVLEGV